MADLQQCANPLACRAVLIKASAHCTSRRLENTAAPKRLVQGAASKSRRPWESTGSPRRLEGKLSSLLGASLLAFNLYVQKSPGTLRIWSCRGRRPVHIPCILSALNILVTAHATSNCLKDHGTHEVMLEVACACFSLSPLKKKPG